MKLYSFKLWDLLNKTRSEHLLYDLGTKRSPRNNNILFVAPFGIMGLMAILINPLALVFVVNAALSMILLLETITRINVVRGYVDLIGLTPLGRAGMYWLWIKRIARTQPICVRLGRLASIFQIISFNALLCVVLLFLIGSVIQLSEGTLRYDQGELVIFLNVAIFTGLVFCDYHYSYLFGVLLGIVIPNYVKHRTFSLIAGLSLLGVIHFAAYFALLNWGTDAIASLLTLCIYLAVRETGIRVTWRLVEQDLNTDMAELHDADVLNVQHTVWG